MHSERVINGDVCSVATYADEALLCKDHFKAEWERTTDGFAEPLHRGGLAGWFRVLGGRPIGWLRDRVSTLLWGPWVSPSTGQTAEEFDAELRAARARGGPTAVIRDGVLVVDDSTTPPKGSAS
jgi:hypothetical protein